AMRDTLLMNGVGGTYQTQQRIPDFRRYEIKDHLGNVRTVISDVKDPVPTYTSGSMNFWKYFADIKNISNMYPPTASRTALTPPTTPLKTTAIASMVWRRSDSPL
ncbi:MAG: hypothetical protein RIF34_05755, partial [Candidatus Kapaibacterium sp.]